MTGYSDTPLIVTVLAIPKGVLEAGSSLMNWDILLQMQGNICGQPLSSSN